MPIIHPHISPIISIVGYIDLLQTHGMPFSSSWHSLLLSHLLVHPLLPLNIATPLSQCYKVSLQLYAHTNTHPHTVFVRVLAFSMIRWGCKGAFCCELIALHPLLFSQLRQVPFPDLKTTINLCNCGFLITHLEIALTSKLLFWCVSEASDLCWCRLFDELLLQSWDRLHLHTNSSPSSLFGLSSRLRETVKFCELDIVSAA